MMKLKYLLAAALMITGFASTFLSCTLTDDEPSENIMQSESGTFSTLGTVMANGEYLTIESDRYGTLIPDNPDMLVQIDADSTGQRILVGFMFLDNTAPRSTHESYPIRIVDLLYKVETRNAEILQEEEEGTFGNDPLQIIDASLSKNHLNIQYNYNGDKQTYHRVSLVVRENSQTDAEGLFPVELRHDANGNHAGNSLESIISFPLESIEAFQSSTCKGLRIIYNSGANSRAEWKALK